MSKQHTINNVKPSIGDIAFYSSLILAGSIILQLFFLYNASILFSNQQCSQLLAEHKTDLIYRNELRIQNSLTSKGGSWLVNWKFSNIIQNYNIEGKTSTKNITILPLIDVSCIIQQDNYLKLELQTIIPLDTQQIVFILTISLLLSSVFLSALIKHRQNIKDSTEAINDLFHEVALHQDSPAPKEDFAEIRISEIINKNKQSLLFYLDNIKHRLDRADEDYTDQLIQNNNELEERYAYLEIQARELKQLTARKSTFFANLSHDFRTPLYTIDGYTRLLDETKLNKRQKTYIDAVKSANNNLSELVTNFLSMSRLEAGGMEIEINDFDLRNCLYAIVDGIDFLITRNNNTVFIDVSKEISSILKVDGNKLRQVLTNLITNAVKYTSNGVIYIHCDVRTIDSETHAINISIADTGKGISQKDLKSIFDPYTRLERDRTTVPGTGLGLGICKELCAVINAELTVNSKIDQGTIFNISFVTENAQQSLDIDNRETALVDFIFVPTNKTLREFGEQFFKNNSLNYTLSSIDQNAELIPQNHDKIPIFILASKDETEIIARLINNIDHDKHILLSISDHDAQTKFTQLKSVNTISNIISMKLVNKLFSNNSNSLEGSNKQTIIQSLKGYKLLLAEDNDLNRFIIEDSLKKLGAQVISCADGAAAIDLYQADSYDAILVDAHMPNLSGTEVTLKIRNEFNDTVTPIIGITASTSSTEYQHFIKSGMSECLIKPLADEILADSLKRLCNIDETTKNQLIKNTKSKEMLNEFSENKLHELIKSALNKHCKNLNTLISHDELDLYASYHEIHKLNGSLSIYRNDELRTKCQDIENLLALHKQKSESKNISIDTHNISESHKVIIAKINELIEEIEASLT